MATQIEVTVVPARGDAPFAVQLYQVGSVIDLKAAIEARTGVPPARQHLTKGGANLPDTAPFVLCGIANGSRVQVTVRGEVKPEVPPDLLPPVGGGASVEGRAGEGDSGEDGSTDDTGGSDEGDGDGDASPAASGGAGGATANATAVERPLGPGSGSRDSAGAREAAAPEPTGEESPAEASSPAAVGSSSMPVDLGVVWKKGRRDRSGRWQKRRVELRGGRLMYYKGKKLQGSSSLRGAAVLRCSAGESSRECSVDVAVHEHNGAHGERRYLFALRSEADVARWEREVARHAAIAEGR